MVDRKNRITDMNDSSYRGRTPKMVDRTNRILDMYECMIVAIEDGQDKQKYGQLQLQILLYRIARFLMRSRNCGMKKLEKK